jgi:CheY-like chemotaxis protein
VEILVVDDSKVMREMIVACLRGEPGLRFTHAASGLEAIERLEQPKMARLGREACRLGLSLSGSAGARECWDEFD